MPKITTFPKTISVKIEDQDDGDDYLTADADATGAGMADGTGKVKVGIYKLDSVVEVELVPTITPVSN